MANYYDDQKRLIATSQAELLTYFVSLGATAQSVPIALPCTPTAILRVSSNVPVPKFLYVDGVSPKNRIYPQLINSNAVNLDSLCNGVDTQNLLLPPDCGTVEFIAMAVVAPDCGTVVFVMGYASKVTITPNTMNGWAIYAVTVNEVTLDGVVTLNISVINSGITTHTLFVNELIQFVGPNGTPDNLIVYSDSFHPNMPPGSTLTLSSAVSGDVFYDGYETSLSAAGAVIEIQNVQYNINN